MRLWLDVLLGANGSSDDRARPCTLQRRIAQTPLQLPWKGWDSPASLRIPRIAALSALPLLLLWFGTVDAPPGPRPVLTAAIIMVAGGLLWAAPNLWYWFADARYGRPLRARRCARAGSCPCCTYRIADIPPAADGCTVCPECGSAWRLPR